MIDQRVRNVALAMLAKGLRAALEKAAVARN
jgi:hypothetical protein